MQRNHQLALVLVNSFDLDIKNGLRIEGHSIFSFNEVYEGQFVLPLYLSKLLAEFFVAGFFVDFLQLIQIGDPVITDLF